MKKITTLLLLAISLVSHSHSISFKGCVDGKLKFYYHTGHYSAFNSRITVVDKNNNPITGSCAYNELKSITNEGYFYVPQSLCNDYTRVRIQCHAGDYTGYFTVNKPSYCQTSLPITLESFNAYREKNNVVLSWRTSNEKDFSHFEIEGGSSLEFSTLQKTLLNNATIDTSLEYFRLKMIDLDGTFTYSKIIFVSKEEETLETLLLTLPNGKIVVKNGVKVFKLN